MKRLVTIWSGLMLALLLVNCPAQAQMTIQRFEHLAAAQVNPDSLSFTADSTTYTIVYTGDPGNGPSPKPHFLLSDYATDPMEGETALQVDWKAYTNQSWGGFMQLVNVIPEEQGTYYDISDFTKISFWYNNMQSTSSPQIEFRLNLIDASEGPRTVDNNAELWYSQTPNVLSQEPGWKLYEMPLVVNPGGAPIPDEGYTLTGWAGGSGNGKLDLDKLSGYVIEWTATPLGGDSTANGVIVFDNLHASGVRYNMLESFDDLADNNAVAFSQTGAGTIVLASDTENPFEGIASLDADWTVDASESWGGYSNLSYNLPEGEFYDDMTARTALSLFYDNVTPASVDGMTLRVKLHDTSEGQIEYWYYENPEILYDESGWTRLKLPLVGFEGGAPSTNGFVIPEWEGFRGNNQLDLDKISGYTIEFVAPADLQGQTITGNIMFDRFSGYGLRETDFTAPAAPQNLDVTTSDFANIVTWEDVPGEDADTYTIYYSFDPITDVDAPYVEVVESGVARGTQVFTHPLVAPATDQDVSYYYAVTSTDPAGNRSEVTSMGPVTNMAKGIVTISPDVPANFVADGDIGEWDGFTPIHLAPSVGSKVITNFDVDDDQDLSVDVYVALGQDAMYLAYDITDDLFEPTGAANPWENDGTEIYVGMYDHHGLDHNNYEGEAQPDVKLVFYSSEVRIDARCSAQVYTTDDENYAYTEKFPSGYVIEAKLPYDAITCEGDEIFTPQVGMRIPLDIVIQDQDEGTRQGIMVYSRDNDDNSWESPKHWAYTWIGDQFKVTTAAEDEAELPERYALDQNYPNPFNPSTLINYVLPVEGVVTLKVYDALGREVATLFDGRQPAGSHTVRFDASSLATGVYFYQLKAGDFTQVKKMVLVR